MSASGQIKRNVSYPRGFQHYGNSFSTEIEQWVNGITSKKQLRKFHMDDKCLETAHMIWAMFLTFIHSLMCGLIINPFFDVFIHGLIYRVMSMRH